MITKFSLYLFGHPFLSFFVIVCIGLGISQCVRIFAGYGGLIRAKKICLAIFSVCFSLLILDGLIALYARTLNPEGYGLLYPLAAALIVFPLAVTFAILAVIFKLMSRRAS